MKKLIALLLALVMVFALVACGNTNNQPSSNPGSATPGSSAPSDEVIEINLSLTFPEVSAAGVLRWEEEIIAATNGRVKFNNYYSYSLVALPDLIKGLQNGTVDMAGMVPYEYPSLFVLNGNLLGVPFMGWKDNTSASEIYWQMLEEHPELLAEYESYGLHYYGSYFMPGYNIFMTKDEPMSVPADLKGHKTITAASIMQQLLADNSGAPVTAGPPDYYSNMEKGVADSIISHINVIGAFGVYPELIKKAVFFGDEYSGAYMILNATVFSQSFWDKLPADIQEIFNEHAPNLGKYMLETDNGLTKKLVDMMEEKGITKVVLSDDEIQVWADNIAPVVEAQLQDWTKENGATMDIYNALLEKIEQSK